jgi:hypothetical protein
MVHGYDEGRRFHYALGVFNGEGLGFNNRDHQFDSMGRAWIAPFSFAGGGRLRDVTIGGSGWMGDRANTVAPATQTTQGGVPFLSFAPYAAAPVGAGGERLLQLRQVGLLRAFAAELNVPVAHRYGGRAELVWRHSPLSEEDVTTAAAPFIVGGADLTGWAVYGELWLWAVGDDRLIGDVQGLEPFNRYRDPGAAAPPDGLMLALRLERLDEQVTYQPDAAMLDLRDPAVGKTNVTSLELAASYWHTKRFRASLNYVFNHLRGDTQQMRALSSPNVHEIGLRLGIAL